MQTPTPIVALLVAGLAACAPRAADKAAPTEAAGWSIAPPGDLNGFFDCVEQSGASLVAAHRGGPAPGFPENALETFANTLRNAPALLEIDVAQSADGVLYLMHDDSLERTTDGAGAANALVWADIAALRLVDETGAPTAFAPPRFDAALAFAEGRSILEIDIKPSARYEDIAETIRRQNAESRVIVIAYTLAQARKLHRLLPETMISLPLASQSAINAAVAGGVPASRLIAFAAGEPADRRLFDALRERGVEAIFAALGGPDSLDRAVAASGDEARYAAIAALGADIIATDRPGPAHAALAAAGRAVSDGECGIARR